MIVGSLLLILVAVVLLVLGLKDGSSVMLTGSIAASLLAAVALVVGARQGNRPDEAFADEGFDGEMPDGEALGADETGEYALAGARGGAGQGGLYGSASATAPGGEPATVTLPAQTNRQSGGHVAPPPAGTGGSGWDRPGTAESAFDTVEAGDPVDAGTAVQGDAAALDDDDDPPDEPAPQVVSAADAARVAQLTSDVLVIDGRPRYHLAGCVHLLGRESEPLAVNEAAELGFTPCSLCEPAHALLN